jgi:inhibitor of growth protein 3
LYEEANAKQESINECNILIGRQDGLLQKWIKASGSLVPHPKEEVMNKQILDAYNKAQRLQDEKIALIQKATSLVCVLWRLLDSLLTC